MCIDSNESLLIGVCFYSSSCCRKLYSGGESSVISLRTLVDLLWKTLLFYTMHFRIMDRFHIVESRPDSLNFNYGRKNQLDGKHLFWLNVAILWMRNLECIAAHESHGTEVNKGDDILIPWHRPMSKKSLSLSHTLIHVDGFAMAQLFSFHFISGIYALMWLQ